MAMTYGQMCDALDREIAAFAETVKGYDPGAVVPTCPGWDMAALVKHIGYSHRWATYIVRERASEPVPFRAVPMGMPEDKAAYPEWLAAGREPLLATLRSTDAATPMWAWGADEHARFWARRQLFETTVHHADAQLALGRQPAIDSERGVEGIDEFLENLAYAASFAPNVKELRGDGESLHFHCTDAEGEWMIELQPDGFRWEHGHGKGSVAVRGAATDLLLLLYGRLAAGEERFQVFGATAVLERWMEKSHI
jgi:uncharacterized protein (TIGR03083 family)